MKLKLLVLGITSAAALALAGPAFAIHTLTVTPEQHAVGGAGDFTIAVTQEDADAPTAKLTIYAPIGYSSVVNQPAGTTIGTANGTVILKALAGARAPVAGNVVTDDPARYVTNPGNLGCTGQATHAAVWLLNLTLAGQTLPVPVYVDPVTAGPETGFAAVKLQVCFSSPDIPQSAGGAANGAQPVAASMTLDNVVTNPQTPGTYTWRTLFTPYVPGTATINAAGTVEARSLVQLPTQLTLTGKRVRRRVGRTNATFVTLSGALTQVNVGVAGQRVAIRANGRALRTVTTGANGRFTTTLRITRRTSFTAVAALPSRRDDATGCAGPSLAPGGCQAATTAPVTVAAARAFAAALFPRR
jgi:hypothetical protein